MKLKFKRVENGEYNSAILRGSGGISSLIHARQGNCWYAISLFLNLKSIIKAIVYDKNAKG